MLQQARNFVHSDVGKNEFLILKFDKCTNWAQIADACRATLGLALYREGGNLNKKTLKDLRGKVVVLFSSSGLREVHGATNGILGFKNLSAEGASYANVYEGLQYYGKGGTSPFNPKGKLKQNVKKQTKLMLGAMAMGNPEIVGMMYWTTTGLIESIKKRDDQRARGAPARESARERAAATPLLPQHRHDRLRRRSEVPADPRPERPVGASPGGPGLSAPPRRPAPGARATQRAPGTRTASHRPVYVAGVTPRTTVRTRAAPVGTVTSTSTRAIVASPTCTGASLCAS
jgi:hypothetical protein